MRIKEKRSDATLMGYTKKQLIEIIRVQEHNLNACDEIIENQFNASLEIFEENVRLRLEAKKVKQEENKNE